MKNKNGTKSPTLVLILVKPPLFAVETTPEGDTKDKLINKIKSKWHVLQEMYKANRIQKRGTWRYKDLTGNNL